ncbi:MULTISPECIES: ABC transporter ATP-binding protein [unclassified Tepidimonas]|jgi:simple sugar transport system ATP-binding protein|uniref:ABC transporter ATP-binding protein n=1 Tax=unclassified Tepidimonas TaxID=2631705 RepID=UPI002627436A|nr:ABC transporter ATP-binding protein [uncultured Tepidimonas sp.]
MSPPPRLQLHHITKRYPGVVANDGVSLEVQPGSIHAVLGENGAGKSTLMKIIYGAVQPDDGAVLFNGRPVHVRNPQEARALGISMVFQHFSLFETLTVAENVWLGLDAALSLREVSESIEVKAREYGLEIDPRRPVHTLSVGERQRVEIVRALLTQPQLLILDEPTSVLTPQAVERLFGVLRQLASEGCSILYISHKLHEIRALCDTCTVMRGGRVTGVCDPRQASNAELSRLMIGSEPPALPPHRAASGDVVLDVCALTLPSSEPFGTDLQAVDLQVRAGEIVGIAGVSGNGQRELLAALSGEVTAAPPGSIRLDGRDIARLGPGPRRRQGLHFVPEERLGRGAVPSMGLAHNLLLTRREAVGPAGWLHLGALRAQARDLIERYRVKAAGPDAAAQSLSGGNLQKFIVGREIDARPRVFIVAQPTWGVDVGAAAQIRAEIVALREAGCAVLVVSEELDELFELCDRLYVMARGRLSPPLTVAQATPQRVGEWMSGLWPQAPEPVQEGQHAAA